MQQPHKVSGSRTWNNYANNYSKKYLDEEDEYLINQCTPYLTILVMTVLSLNTPRTWMLLLPFKIHNVMHGVNATTVKHGINPTNGGGRQDTPSYHLLPHVFNISHANAYDTVKG